jgi:signal transduction histidine kinase
LIQHLEEVQQTVLDLESLAQTRLSDSVLWTELSDTADFSSSAIQLLNESENLRYYLFEGDSLIWWNDNQLALDFSEWPASDGRSALIYYQNGMGLALSKAHGSLRVLALIPLYKYYQIRNDNLGVQFEPGLGFPEGVEAARFESRDWAEDLTPLGGPDDAVYVFKNVAGDNIMPIVKDAGQSHSVPDAFQISLILLSLILFAAFAYRFCVRLAEFKMPFAEGLGLILLTVILASTRLLFIQSALHRSLSAHPLFDPFQYASSLFAGSLGDLMLDVVFILFILHFLRRRVSIERIIQDMKWPRVLRHSLGILGLLLLLRIAARVIRSLVVDSEIGFGMDDFFRWDFLSYSGLLVLALMLWATFEIAWISRSLIKWEKGRVAPSFWLSLLIASVLYVLLDQIIGTDLVVYSIIGWAALFLILRYLSERITEDSIILFRFLPYTLFFSLFAAVLLLRAKEHRAMEDMRVFAEEKVGSDAKLKSVYEVESPRVSQLKLLQDLFARGRTTIKAWEAVSNYIEDDLFRDRYFKSYQISLAFVNADGSTLFEEADWALHPVPEELNHANPEDLFLDFDGTNPAYWGKLPVFQLGMVDSLGNPADSILGYALLRFDRGTRTANRVFPELLQEGLGADEDYAFAVYSNGLLVDQVGEYAYPLQVQTDNSADEKTTVVWDKIKTILGIRSKSSYYEQGPYRHYRFDPIENTSVTVSISRAGWLTPISLFSFLFLLFLVVSVVITFILEFLQGSFSGRGFRIWSGVTLRARIQFLIILLTLFSFVIIGAVTVSYFTNQYDDYHENRLLRKLRSVMHELEFQSAANDTEARLQDEAFPFDKGINVNLSAVSDIHSMDVNIFDLDGKLIKSSQPAIFSEGLISNRLDANARYELVNKKMSSLVRDEQVGSLNYLSAYAPIRSYKGQTIAYIQLPYFAKEKNLREEISDFMVALINVYVLLLLGAGILALFLSNSITRSLSLISQQFQKVQLGGKNEPITWKGEDEIGLLVSEYNKMLGELEHSANLLARSERESAWREMAKQVAHEIKNPLTPMRLSIQHLQRAVADDDPRAGDLTKRVSQTLLEQIDNLTHIANEFSNFAKMPAAQRERINLAEVLDGVVDLFRQADEDVTLSWDNPGQELWIYADRNRMIRVFNNLIKNAIQAIPDDREGNIVLGIEEKTEHFKIWVRDNGIGISPEDQDKVFVPRFTTKNSGMGLGLAMCKNIVESAKGAIWFESTEGEGTTFFVILPKHEAAEAVLT